LQQSVATAQELPGPLQVATEEAHFPAAGSHDCEQHWAFDVQAAPATVQITPPPPVPVIPPVALAPPAPPAAPAPLEPLEPRVPAAALDPAAPPLPPAAPAWPEPFPHPQVAAIAASKLTTAATVVGRARDGTPFEIERGWNRPWRAEAVICDLFGWGQTT
jgi:hypothetical protein